MFCVLCLTTFFRNELTVFPLREKVPERVQTGKERIGNGGKAEEDEINDNAEKCGEALCQSKGKNGRMRKNVCV